jgi:hypothetical protein
LGKGVANSSTPDLEGFLLPIQGEVNESVVGNGGGFGSG